MEGDEVHMLKSILRASYVAGLMILVMTLLMGAIYPLVVTGLSRLLFPQQACGSLISRDGRLVGSALIGQRFTGPAYFHGRPSVAGNQGYDAASSSGSNLGPTSKVLIERAAGLAAKVRSENDLPPNAPVPGDLATASASGLDPHMSVDAAYLQVPRVAQARGLPEEEVKALVEKHIEGRQFGILGEPRVNVLKLNLALDQAEGDDLDLREIRPCR